MLRFFRTHAPTIGLLLLLALLVTLPGIRHPLPMLGLTALAIGGAITVRRWQRAQAARADAAANESVDEAVARSAAAWDARHGAPDDAEPTPDDDEPWRASLRDDREWRGSANPWSSHDDE
jgi:hypothetical protein